MGVWCKDRVFFVATHQDHKHHQRDDIGNIGYSLTNLNHSDSLKQPIAIILMITVAELKKAFGVGRIICGNICVLPRLAREL